jgi:hypothetical protein
MKTPQPEKKRASHEKRGAQLKLTTMGKTYRVVANAQRF